MWSITISSGACRCMTTGVIFEFLTLEAAQAGLSWYTVLRKRGAYRDAFADFDPQKVARYGKKQIEALLKNPGIIRNRLKIAAAVNNAGKFLEVQNEFGSFDRYIWRFVDGKPIVNRVKSLKDYPATSPESDALSKDLKQRGFKFVGSTISMPICKPRVWSTITRRVVFAVSRSSPSMVDYRVDEIALACGCAL